MSAIETKETDQTNTYAVTVEQSPITTAKRTNAQMESKALP